MFVRDDNLMIGNCRRGSFRLTRALGDDFRSQTITVAFQRDAGGRVSGFLANAGERNRNTGSPGRDDILSAQIHSRAKRADGRLGEVMEDVRAVDWANARLAG